MNKCIQGINDLYTWCKNNKLRGERILAEWTGKDQYGNDIDIHKISYGKYLVKNKPYKIIWKCSNCKQYFLMSVLHRTTCGQNCNKCNTYGTSYTEQYIYLGLKTVFNNCKNREKIDGYEFDIVVPDIKTYIEYSPTCWHDRDDKRLTDIAKRALCKSKGIRLLQIIEDTYNDYSIDNSDDTIVFHMDYSKQEEISYHLLLKILGIICPYENNLYIDRKNIDNEAFSRSRSIDKELSLEYRYKTLSKYWNTELNNIKSSEITPFSNKQVYWICKNCGYGFKGEWFKSPKYIIRINQTCPNCNFNIVYDSINIDLYDV